MRVFTAHVPPNTATAKLLISNYLNAGFDTITEGKPALVIPIPLINVIGITIAILVQLVTKPLLSSITNV